MCIGEQSCSGIASGEFEEEKEQCTCTTLKGSSSDVEDVSTERPFGFCNPDPCQNGASCFENQEGFSCDCQPGYEGRTCNEDIDDCWPPPCQNGGNCTDKVFWHVQIFWCNRKLVSGWKVCL